MGKHPEWNIIATSYAASLANAMSRDVKRIIECPEYNDTFPETNMPTMRGQAVSLIEEWETLSADGNINSGCYKAAGAGGGITGMGMNVGIIDDPSKDYSQASSPAYQEMIMDWYETTFYTRRDPKHNGIIIILTRWHQNDLAGQLLKKAKEGGEQFRVVSFPMEAEKTEVHELNGKTYTLREPGEILFPERMPPDFVQQCKDSGSLTWNALYQQRPTAKGGSLIRTSDFGSYSVIPQLEYRYIIGDTAQKQGEHNDFSVFEEWGKGKDGNIYLLDIIRGKWTAGELKAHASAFWTKCMARDAKLMGKLRRMCIEDKSSGTGLIQELQAKGKKIPVKAIPRIRDKHSRFMDIQGYIEGGFVYLPSDAAWLSSFLMECEGTTSQWKSHDDQIDPMIDAIDMMLTGSGVVTSKGML
jgi:predicted phage terminase large subunit-like protein